MGITLEQWLEEYEQAYTEGQTGISRSEAIRRWQEEQESYP